MKIIVVGSGGQLGQTLQSVISSNEIQNFIFLSRNSLDITDSKKLEEVITKDIDYVVNLAAFTNVDLAETEEGLAYEINAVGPHELAKICYATNTTLIHISTDYVYDNDLFRPLLETDACHPKSIYAKSKYEGELNIINEMDRYFIIRTSWLYSEFGNNFLKTIIRLSESQKEINVVDDQVGTPTSCETVAAAILEIIKTKPSYGIYNISDLGASTWYEYASYIVSSKSLDLHVKPISTEKYGAAAPRPPYSVMNCLKIENAIPLPRSVWQKNVKEVLDKI